MSNKWNDDAFELDLGDSGASQGRNGTGPDAGSDRMLEEIRAAMQAERLRKQQAEAAAAAAQAQQSPVRQATQADTGWRNQQPQQTPVRQATQADTGWRNQQQPQQTPVRQATQADTGWRNQQQPQQTPVRQATQADTGWRNQQPQQTPVREATQADTGWRAQQTAQPAAPSTAAPAASVASLQDFKAAVEQLPELVSTSGTRYSVIRTLSREGGESAVMLCRAPNGGEVVAKVFYEQMNTNSSSFAARRRVLEYMRTPEGQKYTLAVMDNGVVEIGGGKYYFEITPFCKEGDLSGEPPYSFAQITELAKYLNEAVHSMHSAGILHRDIKPANLYRYQGRIVIGDFGIAKLVNAGMTNTTGGTDGFRAPESVLAVTAGETAFYFDEACDYYSLGVTLGTLYEGHFVYQDMTAAMITIAVRQGKLPLSKVDPNRTKLENLLNGLCRYDSRYRFGYNDVRKWLDDHNYSGSIIEDEWPRAFRMMNEEYTDEKSMFEGITKDAAHWNEGKDMLYSKYFENFFMSFRTDLARAAQVADEKFRGSDRDKGLFMFLKSLYAPGPIVWKGYTFTGLRALGEKMVVTRTPAAYGEILQKQIISHWLKHTEGVNADANTVSIVDAIEKTSQKEPELACYWFGNSFAAKKSVQICGQVCSDLQDVLRIMFRSAKSFYDTDGYEKLMDRKAGAAFYGFLYSFGFRQIIDAQWAQAQKCDEFNKACLLLSMLDSIAAKVGADSSLLRSFFTDCGPVGIAVYTRQLVTRNQAPVYSAMNSEGQQLLSQIAGFRPVSGGSVEELYRGYMPLVDLVKKLQTVVVDNPFEVTAGVYVPGGVLCTNLAGCFAYNVFGRMAPLGFHAWIETSEGRAAR